MRTSVGFKNPTYADDAAELLLFCKVIFRIGMTHKCRLKLFQTAVVLYAGSWFHAYDYAAFGRRACLRIVAGKSKEAV